MNCLVHTTFYTGSDTQPINAKIVINKKQKSLKNQISRSNNKQIL